MWSCTPFQGEVIFRIGDVGHEAYFILKGNVAVMNKHKELLAVLSSGERVHGYNEGSWNWLCDGLCETR
jgi:hypothetical protein